MDVSVIHKKSKTGIGKENRQKNAYSAVDVHGRGVVTIGIKRPTNLEVWVDKKNDKIKKKSSGEIENCRLCVGRYAGIETARARLILVKSSKKARKKV